MVKLFKEGYCTPQIARIAKTINEPSATIHYNIKKLENEGTIKTYRAVFDYKKIDEGFCVYILVALSPSEYLTPERIARNLTKHEEVESVDLVAGDWELIVKVRTKGQDEYYNFLRDVISKEKGLQKTKSMISLKSLKTEFVLV
ncbi:MAG: Lrp/AsnC family transcriptional regulator [Candidatus Bathyarchaeota archaeon]|nr:Lrp/AsnC family transcriptional regulator [Candidatus Bathyarchaeota archaeon]MDH5495522.1 Lrp/AsnC family transcriptional regulator [Candidatus Bathyarchaeota archaeon]